MKPYLVVYVVDGMTLVRGADAKRVLQLLGARPYWSRSGRGWVVQDSEICHDISAYCQSIHTFAAISYRRPT